MAKKGRIKRVFPGGNTAKGFYSYYDQILGTEAVKLFIIKGGPGVGKSSFMKKIGFEMIEKGFDVEFHQCSSDNGSLDGVVIRDLNIGIIDGTAPHVGILLTQICIEISQFPSLLTKLIIEGKLIIL